MANVAAISNLQQAALYLDDNKFYNTISWTTFLANTCSTTRIMTEIVAPKTSVLMYLLTTLKKLLQTNKLKRLDCGALQN